MAQMGLGKTPTSLLVVDDCLHDRIDGGRWLVVAPKHVAADTWPRALRRWEQIQYVSWRHLTFENLDLKAAYVPTATGKRKVGMTFGERSDKASAKRMLQQFPEQLHICSWDLFPWVVEAYGANFPYDGLILDESLNAQNSTSQRHKAAYHVIHRLKRVQRVIMLSGMPSPNGYEQWHGQMRLLDGGSRLGNSKSEFYSRWMVPKKRGPDGVVWSWKLATGAKDEIDRLVGELCVSLSTKDYLNLPEMLINPLQVTLPPAARAAYDELEEDLVTQIEGQTILAPSAGVKVGKLLQICNGAVYDKGKKPHRIHDAKLETLQEALEGISGPALLAYSFAHDWERIRGLGKGFAHVSDPGALDSFRSGKLKLLAMHPESADGLDGLQNVCSNAIWFGATYNAKHWGQFNFRLWRDGSNASQVVIHQILAGDTLEDSVAGKTLPDKVDEQDSMLEAISLRRAVRHGEAC